MSTKPPHPALGASFKPVHWAGITWSAEYLFDAGTGAYNSRLNKPLLAEHLRRETHKAVQVLQDAMLEGQDPDDKTLEKLSYSTVNLAQGQTQASIETLPGSNIERAAPGSDARVRARAHVLHVLLVARTLMYEHAGSGSYSSRSAKRGEYNVWLVNHILNNWQGDFDVMPRYSKDEVPAPEKRFIDYRYPAGPSSSFVRKVHFVNPADDGVINYLWFMQTATLWLVVRTTQRHGLEEAVEEAAEWLKDAGYKGVFTEENEEEGPGPDNEVGYYYTESGWIPDEDFGQWGQDQGDEVSATKIVAGNLYKLLNSEPGYESPDDPEEDYED